MNSCSHIPDDLNPPEPSTLEGCTHCIEEGRSDWVHLRECQICGLVGCCDSSPERHASKHAYKHSDHMLVRSIEPGENWWYCYIDDVMFDVPGEPPSPTRTI